ncbi:MAG: amidohydrolase family protein [Kiritimatiellae bacterium]|nr:amidohydrolase family protein [Kiritimatiellia bacterium]
MTVDFHAHNFPDAIAARAMAGMLRATEGVLTSVGDGTLSNHLDHMDHDGIDRACLLQIATKPSQFEVLFRTACAIRDGEFGERAQRKIIVFPSVHPADPDLSGRLERIASGGFKGVKVHPYYQNFDLADPSVWPMFRKIAELGLVVESHCGFDVGYPSRSDACGPAEVATLLRNVRDLKFVAAHLGGCAGFAPHATDPLLDLGCWIDTSALMRNWYRDEEMRILRSWPAERLLFATDFPWTSYSEAIRWVKEVRDPADWDAVFGGNARALLGI